MIRKNKSNNRADKAKTRPKRVASAVVDGIGVVGVPANGEPFHSRKSFEEKPPRPGVLNRQNLSRAHSAMGFTQNRPPNFGAVGRAVAGAC